MNKELQELITNLQDLSDGEQQMPITAAFLCRCLMIIEKALKECSQP